MISIQLASEGGKMKYYLSPSGEVFAYELDGSQDSVIPADFALMSDEELAAVRARQQADQAPTISQLISIALARRDELLSIAGLRISPLQDAIDLDDATPEDIASLTLWKQYRIAINRVNQQAGFPSSIEWPEQPS